MTTTDQPRTDQPRTDQPQTEQTPAGETSEAAVPPAGGAPAGGAAAGAAPAGDAQPLPRRGRRSVFFAVVLAAVVLGAFVVLLVGAKEPDGRSTVVGKPAPSADRPFGTLKGEQQVRIADFRGRYVVLNFFASWCRPCLLEHPELLAFQQQHAALGDATVVQVLYSDKPGPARSFFQEHGDGGWPVLIDPNGQFALDYGVTGPPTSFLLDPQGNVLASVKAAINQAGLEDLLTRAKQGRP